MNVINLAERRILRAQARHTVGQCAAVMQADRVATEAQGKITKEALTRWHLVQEAIDEFLASGEKFHIGDVVNLVNTWEKMLNDQA